MIKQLPNSDVIERMLISSMVLDHATLETCRDMLIIDDFYFRERSELFVLIASLPRVDLTIVQAALRGHKRGALLADELDACIRQREFLRDAFSTEDYCSELRDRRVCRELGDFGGHLAVEITKGVPVGADFIDAAEVRIGRILSGRQDASRRPESAGEIFERIAEACEEPEGAGDVRLSGTGIRDLDDCIGGFERGAFYVIAGRPGMGKSAMAMQMARQVAEDHRTLIFSYEMPTESLAIRVLSSITSINSRRIQDRKTLTADELRQLKEAAAGMRASQMRFMHPRGRSLEEMRSQARDEHRKNGGKLGCIVVDYLQLMEAKGKWGTKDQELGHISHSLKALAMELNCAVIAPVAISREAEKRADKRPIMSDMRECGSIEYDANVMIGIYRPDADPTATVDSALRNTAQAIIMKQRNGQTGIVNLRFVPETTTFLSPRANLRSIPC